MGYMGERIKIDTKFLSESLSEKERKRNLEIFKRTGLIDVVEKIVVDSNYEDRILYRRWGDVNYSRLLITEDFLSPGITKIPCGEIDEVKREGQTIFEGLVLNGEIFIKDNDRMMLLPEGNKEDLRDFILEKINNKEEKKEKKRRIFFLEKLFFN